MTRDDLDSAYAESMEQQAIRAGWRTPIHLIPRRTKILWHATRIGRAKRFEGSDFLLEYNLKKAAPAQRVFRRPLVFVHPRDLRFRGYECVLLFVASFVVTRRRLVAMYLQILAKSLDASIPKNATIHLFNPYHMLHLAAAMVDRPSAIYFGSGELLMRQQKYFSNADTVFGTSETLKHGVQPSQSQVVTVVPEHTFVSSANRVAVYFTALDRLPRYANEERLGEFALWINQHVCEPLCVYLHYLDTASSDWPHRLEELGLAALISRVRIPCAGQGSLHELSSCQISFSAASSIGGDLISLGVRHFVFEESTSMPFDAIADVYGLTVRN